MATQLAGLCVIVVASPAIPAVDHVITGAHPRSRASSDGLSKADVGQACEIDVVVKHQCATCLPEFCDDL